MQPRVNDEFEPGSFKRAKGPLVVALRGLEFSFGMDESSRQSKVLLIWMTAAIKVRRRRVFAPN